MGKPAARIGDMHVCPKVDPGPKPHVGGPVAAGPGNVLINGIPAARVGDKLVCCGPPDTITEGSPTVLINGKPAAFLGSGTAHGGSITIGSANVLIGIEPPDFGTGDTGLTASTVNTYQNPEPYIDPDTASKNHDAWRRPKTNGKTVNPYSGTRPPDDAPITITNYDQRGQTQTLTGEDDVNYTVTRDRKGFPVFTIFETYISDEYIGTGDKKSHFKAANLRMKTLLTQNPTLAEKLGLTSAQVGFFMRKAPADRSPPNLTWHHHQDVGKMQLVNKEKHKTFRHTGGMAIWGGGNGKKN